MIDQTAFKQTTSSQTYSKVNPPPTYCTTIYSLTRTSHLSISHLAATSLSSPPKAKESDPKVNLSIEPSIMYGCITIFDPFLVLVQVQSKAQDMNVQKLMFWGCVDSWLPLVPSYSTSTAELYFNSTQTCTILVSTCSSISSLCGRISASSKCTSARL